MRYKYWAIALFAVISAQQIAKAQITLDPVTTEAKTKVETKAQVKAEANEIVVVGSSSNFKLNGKSLKAMVEAFNDGAAEFAPGGKLLFQVQSAQNEPLQDISLSLRTGDDLIDIVLDKDGIFTLPPLSGKSKSIQLIANRAKTSIKIKPLVFSTSYTPITRRLGDLRLECRVMWAGLKSTVSIFLQAGFGVLGGCSSTKIGFYFSVPAPISSVFVNGDKYEGAAISKRDGLRYIAPINEKKFANDAILTLTPAN